MTTTRPPRILCLCAAGMNRSGAMKHLLTRHLGADCISAGLKRNTPETLKALSDWADHIVVADVALKKLDGFKSLDPAKTTVLNIGRDVYGRSNHPRLLRKAKFELTPLAGALGGWKRKKAD